MRASKVIAKTASPAAWLWVTAEGAQPAAQHGGRIGKMTTRPPAQTRKLGKRERESRIGSDLFCRRPTVRRHVGTFDSVNLDFAGATTCRSNSVCRRRGDVYSILGVFVTDQSYIAKVLPTNELCAPAQPSANSAKIQFGKVIPPQQQILIYSPEEWESFVQEWATGRKSNYVKVVRLAGATDMGIDVAGLTEATGFFGIWDNFQCKHYDSSLTPSDALPEIGKMLWHSFQKEFSPPRTYRFMAPKGCGISLQKLLLKPIALREKLFEKWDDWCSSAITSKQKIKLEGDFRSYCEAYDYGSFTYVNPLEVIDEHRVTPYFAARFGGGLVGRPPVDNPPEAPTDVESRYLCHLFEAYGDNKKIVLVKAADLDTWPELTSHYHRQRESFYHAESLRNFARDTVPPGTFEALQDEVYAGVVDIGDGVHADGLARLTAVAQAATMLPLTENGLISVVKVQDRRGICHQLANVDRLIWRR
ncbi:ABC-three component system protein [Aminobacter sp. AP02]|uniref:ABC-three component system protein n=1 Tax=Aminobacter sp. AP02 TaxID=2135737 RepID=UPI000D7ABEE1|nr:ABC-three component system protein [Aminobacter sp. AP02]PWK63682.1 hypothetical protein C8K44_1233 [Aminobacter sp. AP02]